MKSTRVQTGDRRSRPLRFRLVARLTSVEDLERLISSEIPEGPSLEYKAELHLDTRTQRLEALKDLTGLGNGGGGTIAFGLVEGKGDFPVAESVSPLTDRTLVGRLEDIVRAAVRPPLLSEWSTIEVPGGYALAVDVIPSSLGPYMVEAYDNHQYHRRIGTRTFPMAELEIRDAYALAARTTDARASVWAAHALPMELPDEAERVWISVAAIPHEPLRETFDPGILEPENIDLPQALRYHVDWFGLEYSLRRLGRWADGLMGHNGRDAAHPSTIARLHRDGAAGLAVQTSTPISPYLVARIMNAELASLAWFWDALARVGRPIELRCRVGNLRDVSLARWNGMGDDRTIAEPPGVPVHHVDVSDEVLPWDIRRAAIRHRLVRRLADRLLHAYGQPNQSAIFESGKLYTGTREAGASLYGPGIWLNDRGRARPLGRVHADGNITNNAGDVAAHIEGGVIIDLDGDTLAVVEMAVGRGCPDDFLPWPLAEDPRASVPQGTTHAPADRLQVSIPAPTTTSRWSDRSLTDALPPMAG